MKRAPLFLLVVPLVLACRKDAPKKAYDPNTARLREYCESLKVGDATPEVPSWIPQQGSRPNDISVQLVLGGKSMSTCHLTIDTVNNRISALRYQPD